MAPEALDFQRVKRGSSSRTSPDSPDRRCSTIRLAVFCSHPRRRAERAIEPGPADAPGRGKWTKTVDGTVDGFREVAKSVVKTYKVQVLLGLYPLLTGVFEPGF